MLDVVSWFASLVMLSVAVTQLEILRINSLRTLTRAAGWCLVGLEAFAAFIHPFWPHYAAPGCKVGMIGLAVLALTYGWQGATRKTMGHRRADDR